MSRVAGIVIEVQGERATVACQHSNATGCSTCESSHGCGWRRAGSRSKHLLVLRAVDPPLRPGDSVEIEVDDGRLLGAAGRLYLPPLAGLLLGPALLRIAGLDSGALPALAALTGLLAGLVVARRWVGQGVPLHWAIKADPATDR